MLYTKKGDLGDTGLYGCDQRISKSSAITEALGVLDETNALLGVCKSKAQNTNLGPRDLNKVLGDVQEKLFIVMAQVAGADKQIAEDVITEMEKTIREIEKELPEIKSFFVPGGSELSAYLDFARTIARRAERRVVAVAEEGVVDIDTNTLKYLNRLSSLLYALVRWVNMKEGVEEKSPQY